MSHPMEIFESENVHDDDGPIIDQMLIEVDAPPDMHAALQPIPATPVTPPKSVTRTLTGYQIVSSSRTDPFMLLPADANRLQFHMDVYSTIATPTQSDFILWADERSKLALPADGSTFQQADMGRIHTSNNFISNGLDLDVHTGPIWILVNPSITAAIELTYWSTTK